jgi:signal peptidase I
MTSKGTRRGAREIFLTLGALLGVICIAATVAGFAFGIKPLIFRSGSMSPAIHTGDLSISRTVDASALERGDIVSVINSSGNRVTHRLVNAARNGDSRQLTLKGDANTSADTEVYTVTRAERVLFTIPKAGYVVNAATSPVGVFVLGLYAATMLLMVFRRRPPDNGGLRKRGGSRRAERPSRRSRKASRSMAVAVAGTALLVAGPAVAAPWTDTVPVTGSTYTASALPAPATFMCGGVGLLSVTFNWAAVPGATGYTLHYGNGGASTKSVSGTTTSITAAISGGTAWVVADKNYGSTTWTSASSNTRNYTVAVVSLCG